METRSTAMSSQELRKLRVIWDIQAKRMTQKEGAEKLGLSVRQVRRLSQKIKNEGEKGIVHGLVGRISNNALSLTIRENIISLWKTKYKPAGFNIKHFSEKLNNEEDIEVSRESVRSLLRQEGLIDKTLRKVKKHRKKRDRKLCIGEMVQLDTSPHDWMNTGEMFHAVVAIDDATSKLLYLKLYEHDGTLPNMEAMKFITEHYGLPISFYTDRAAWFTVTRNGEGSINKPDSSKDYQTQIERALDELGVELILAGSPQAKGRVERANRTLQDRLISELALRGIKTIEEANEYIQNEFIAEYNKNFAIKPQSSDIAFVPMANKEILDDIFCLKMTSVVRNDNTISRQGKYLIQILPTPYRLNWSKAKVDVHIRLDGTVKVYHSQSGEDLPTEIKELKIPTEFKHRKVWESLEEDIFTLQKADISI